MYNIEDDVNIVKIDENTDYLEVSTLRIYNELDSDGDIKISIDYQGNLYININELDSIIKFLTNIKNREDKRIGK